MKLFSNCKALNFEPSFDRICQALIEMWLFEHEFQHKKFWLTSKFWGYQIIQQTADKISIFCWHFQLKLKLEGKNNEF